MLDSVELIAKFEAFKEAVWHFGRVLYKKDGMDDSVRYRIRSGKLGYDKTLSRKNDAEEIVEIEAFLKTRSAVEVEKAVDGESFFA